MTKAELETFRQRLVDMGTRLEGNVSSLTGEALRPAGGEQAGGLSNVPIHPADLGTDNYEQEVATDLLGNERDTLAAVRAALDRIEQGTYGACEVCGRPISRERLDTVPYATLCIDHARTAGSRADPDVT
jgi:RNA polymerase-binding transcription factor DksA